MLLEIVSECLPLQTIHLLLLLDYQINLHLHYIPSYRRGNSVLCFTSKGTEILHRRHHCQRNKHNIVVIQLEFDVFVRANNPNDEIWICYEKDSSAEIFYNNLSYVTVILTFCHPSNNVKVIKTMLKGNKIKLINEDWKALVKT